ncbi:hypothetical protein HS7_07300 [Sulfolobales archaeon HS-7]|nr:hypothetical protein HS7_07300 [Sulfolobales archaeon HS-7]
MVDYERLYYHDVIYVKHKGKPTHFVFMSNIKEDPYGLTETYKLWCRRWFKTRKARIELIRRFRNKLFLHLIYTLPDIVCNLHNFLSFNFKAPGEKPIIFNEFVDLL